MNERRDTGLDHAAPVGLFRADGAMTLQAVNPRLCALTGRTAAELVGLGFRDLLTRSSQMVYALKVETALLAENRVDEIFLELAGVRDLAVPLKTGRIALAVLTIASAWAFIHLMFALHYAHDYYVDRSRGGNGGLQFPGETDPDYGDFLYFAAVIGTSGQTADVSFASRPMRRIGLLHCVLAYAFNTTLLALTINIASGLL